MRRMKAELEAAIREFLGGMFRILGEPVELRLEERPREILIDLQGVEIFSGEDRESLRALGYLVELLLKRLLRVNFRVQIDVNGYRHRREEELHRMALKLAEEVRRERKRIRLNRMEPWERKAIHEALSEVVGVRTHSEGRGAERRVIIEPASR
ncbi:MAG: protein jag [Candidatus Bipolaricaulia bacterium]